MEILLAIIAKSQSPSKLKISSCRLKLNRTRHIGKSCHLFINKFLIPHSLCSGEFHFNVLILLYNFIFEDISLAFAISHFSSARSVTRSISPGRQRRIRGPQVPVPLHTMTVMPSTSYLPSSRGYTRWTR
jgi:hypothetical protein